VAQFSVATELDCPFEHARARFNQHLFEQLIKGFPPVFLKRFDGVHVGAHTELRLGLPLGPRWVSIITNLSDKPDSFSFTDQGTVLPPGLRSWTHVHTLEATTDRSCRLTDSITLGSYGSVTEALMVRIFEANMRARQPVYRSYFGLPSKPSEA
jgi:ligand-binding SRPBCC domain-containing protein